MLRDSGEIERAPRKAGGPPPPRLSDGRGEVAAALRQLRQGPPPPSPLDESAAWRRLDRVGGGDRGPLRPWWLAAGAASAAAAAALFVVVQGGYTWPGGNGSAHREIAYPHPGATPGATAAGTTAAAAAPGGPGAVQADLGVPAGTHHGGHAPRQTGAVTAGGSPPAPAVASSAGGATSRSSALLGLEAPAPPPRLALAARAQAIPSGALALLADEATVEVAAGGKARASADPRWVRVVLDSGEVSLHVEKRREGGPGFEVAAGPFRFRVLGTRFRVARVPGTHQIELWVEEGRVAVTGGGRALGVVEAGGHWAGRAAPRAPAVVAALEAGASSASSEAGVAVSGRAAAEAPEAPVMAPTRARCAEMAAAATPARAVVDCYLAVGRSGGVGAETALYEAGRLRRDALRDPAGALESFRLYRARFPHGLLRAEVDLSIIELLPKVNLHREALAEIGRLLAAQQRDVGRERAPELLLLRGNIYREVLEDFTSAERDYAVVEAARAPFAGEASFFRGVCLQALGRADEARAAFERYLVSGHRRFGDEARRRLGRLGN